MTAVIASLGEGARVAGRYRIDALIAQGGMGAVYRAVDESSGARVALKLRTERGERAARMFEREYHTLVSLEHPRIIEVYDYGVDAAGAYYTMELLDGRDLRDLAPLPYRRACRYLRDVASSLALLHARRLLHRDISPRNVRVTSDDRCKLIDFGVLATFGVADVVAGTPPLLPPEALFGAQLDQRADLFSLGALAYWLLTRRHAFAATAIDELPGLWQRSPPAPSAAREAPADGSALEPIPEALDVLVLALLARNPLARPASAAEVIDRLTAIAGLDADVEPLAAESYLSGGRTVGREREQARLLERLTTALAGTGTSTTIDADPGLGSSRLLAELAVEAQLRGATPLVVDVQLQRGAYGAVRDLVAKLLEALPEQALRAAQPHATILAHFSRELRARLPEVPAVAQKLAPGELRMRLQKALADWLFAISDEHPLVIAIDNAHRLDDASGALIATLAYHVRDHKLMLVAAVKPGEEVTAPLAIKSLHDTGARMRLEPLRRAEVEDLLQGLFGHVPHLGRLSERLYRASAGNPQGCVDLVRDLVRQGVIRHAAGVWVLPMEIVIEDSLGATQAHARLLERLPAEARTLAEALSVHVGPLPLERCLAIAEHERIADAWNALEHLTREEVLGRAGTLYHFVHDNQRKYLQKGLEAGRRRALHRRMGDAFAAGSDGDVDAMLDAGFHLLHGGEEGRGADLLARAGLLLGYDSDEMGAAIPPLRAALAVFRKERRASWETAQLLGPLCNAGWYCDRRLADEYGDEAIGVIADLLGLSLAARLRPLLGKHLSLYIGLAFAALRFVLGKGYGGVEGLRAMVVMYFNCVLSVAGVATTCLDAERARGLARRLEHLTALGEDHAATLSYRFAVLLSRLPEDHLAETIAGYRILLARVRSDAPIRDLPDDSRLMILGGITYALGALESFRDGKAALEHAEALDGIGLKLYAMVADQVRANYHACRGEAELANRYRDRVEMHAVQAGSGWQAEVWAPASAVLACIVTEDVIGMKRTSEELARLAEEIPSLARHAGMAVAGGHLLRGEAELARDGVRSIVERGAPRSFIGWGAMCGAWARASNELGQFGEAKATCERTLAMLSDEDQELTAMYLILHLELALADARLGDREAAVLRVDRLLEKHAESGGPVTMGSLHRTRALLALCEGDEPGAREHLDAMERHVRPTGNPALLQQCERLRARLGFLERDEKSRPTGDEEIRTAVDSLASASTTLSMTRRAQLVLSVVVGRMGGQSGYLFDARGEGLTLIASAAGDEPPEHVIDRVRRDIRSFARHRRGASAETDASPPTVVGNQRTQTALRPREHDYRTAILSTDGERVVGVAAVLAGERPAPLAETIARAAASYLVAGRADSSPPVVACP